MNANLVRHFSTHRPPAYALFALLAGFSLALAAPVAAGGLNDFQKKGNSSGSGGKTTPGKDSGDRARPSSDGRPERDNGSKPGVFDKKPGWRPANDAKANRPGPATPSSAGGGLQDIFKKRAPGQPTHTGSDGPPPPVIINRPPPVVIYTRPGGPAHRPDGHVWEQDPMPAPHHHDGAGPYRESALAVLRNMERGWREARYSLIAPTVADGRRIAIYLDGVFDHMVTAREYRDLCLQTFRERPAARFEFVAAHMVGDDEVVADAEHFSSDRDGRRRLAELRYTLRRSGRHWYIFSIDLRER